MGFDARALTRRDAVHRHREVLAHHEEVEVGGGFGGAVSAANRIRGNDPGTSIGHGTVAGNRLRGILKVTAPDGGEASPLRGDGGGGIVEQAVVGVAHSAAVHQIQTGDCDGPMPWDLHDPEDDAGIGHNVRASVGAS